MFFDLDARRSSPTIHFDEVDPNIEFVEAYRSLQIGLDQIGIDWISFDQIGSDWIGSDWIGSDDLGMTQG